MSLELKNLILMIVEDMAAEKKQLTRVLRPHFATIIMAQNGEEGLKKFKKYKPHLVITDIKMPIRDGLEMAKEIKKISKSTPIIVLTSQVKKDRLLRAIDINIDKFLVKPFNESELIDAIESIVFEKLEATSEIEISANYKFDQIKKVIIKNGEEIELTKKELSFISLLVRNVGALVTHDDIKATVWINSNVSNAAIRTFVKRLRDKVGASLIKNKPGLGYKIESQA